MQTRLTLRPGARGTKKLHEFYGDRLVCVRYRYDPETGKRVKTVEIVVDQREWLPAKSELRPHDQLPVEIGYHEIELRTRVKEAGGRWDRERKVWILPMHRIAKLGLQHRIQES